MVCKVFSKWNKEGCFCNYYCNLRLPTDFFLGMYLNINDTIDIIRRYMSIQRKTGNYYFVIIQISHLIHLHLVLVNSWAIHEHPHMLRFYHELCFPNHDKYVSLKTNRRGCRKVWYESVIHYLWSRSYSVLYNPLSICFIQPTSPDNDFLFTG